MPRPRYTPCATCGKPCHTDGKGPLPATGRICADCRGWGQNAGKECVEPDCSKPVRTRGLCKTHYNKATGNYIGTVPKDLERERARQRLKTYRRKDWSRLTDIMPEYEMALRAKAKRCPMCSVKLTDQPYLPHSKELDHIIPRGVGGTHTIGNVRIVCRTCNLARPNDGSDYAGPVTLWAQEVA